MLDAPGSMTVASGERFDPLAPKVEDVHITDIARSLSRICRYGGHVGHWLSVARHSVWVSDRLAQIEGPELAFAGLLHDAAEAYIGDMVRPLKHGTKMGDVYKDVELEIEAVIAIKFKLTFPFPAKVHEADNYVLLNKELAGPTQRWHWRSTPDQDEAVFMERYHSLRKERLET